jgi:transcriptional regulator
MYVPSAFVVADETEINEMLERIPLGTLITHDPEGLFASHLPFVHYPQDKILAGHLARANPHRSRAGKSEALVIFQGLNAYVTPNWYPSKAEHGRVVPTWNYEAIHVYGRIYWHENPEWLRANVEALTKRFEADQPRPWKLEDAPADHVDSLIRGIVGVEFHIDRVEAKRKLSQNRSDADRQGVISGLSNSGVEQNRYFAEIMRTSKS